MPAESALAVPQMMAWWTVVLAVGTVQGAVLVAALWVPPARTRSAMLAAAAASAVVLMLAEELLDLSGLQAVWPHTAGLTMNLELALGPLVFLHARSLHGINRTTRHDGLHFGPFLTSCLLLLPFYLADGHQKLAWLRHPPAGLELLFTVKGLHLFTYLALTYRELGSAEGPSRCGAALYRRAVGLALAVGAASFLLHHLGRSGVRIPLDSDRLSGLFLTALLCLAAYGALRQWRWSALGPPVSSGDDPSLPYRTSPLSPSRMEAICGQVSTVMRREELFRDTDLRLGQLARRLGLSPHHLSQSLNQGRGESFYELVNRFRVEAFQASLTRSESDGRSILDLAFEAGFNSKAAFHRAFKRATGMTPSDSRRACKAARGEVSLSVERDDEPPSRL